MAAIDAGEWGEERSSWLIRQWELQTSHAFLWTPVLLAAGIAAYFALPIEPHYAVFAGCALVSLLLIFVWRRSGGFLAPAIALILAGFLLSKVRAEWVAAPMLPATTDEVQVAGIIEEIETKGSNRAAITLKVLTISSLDQRLRPDRLRLSLSGNDTKVAIGQTISGNARLRPLPVPVIPGGFDYGRTLWFEGIGGTGRFTGDIEIVEKAISASYWLPSSLAHIRTAIGARIGNTLSGGLGSFAEALITGERGSIPKEMNESLQVSGLAHVLSISGLHLSLVAGGIFWLVRALLALSPSLAQRRPIKKWAAVAALITGFGYMLLAGADVATQRSYMMLAIMFVAILLDRPAISMRNLAIAALVILATTPEAALTAGFQMSFMAVMGLAAFYEMWSDRQARRQEHVIRGPVWRMSRTVVLSIAAMAATTLVAGSLSSIPAAYHFGRIAPLSLIANLLALPIIGFVVMPSAVVSVLLMPLGLEALPLWIMGEGLRLVLIISDWVASLPAADLSIAPISVGAATILTAGAVFLCLWRGLPRLAGVVVMVIGVLISPFGARPDIFIDPTASTVAVRGKDGLLAPADPRRGRFAVEKWLGADGETISLAKAASRPSWTCKDKVCMAEVAGKRVGYIREGGFLSGRCGEFDILIADYPLRGSCPDNKIRIDRFDVWRNGAYALAIQKDTIDIRTSRGEQGARPWTVTPIPRRILVSGDFDEVQ